MPGSQRGVLAEPQVIKATVPAVIQVVALHRGFFGGTSAAWTGSGTVVHPSGIILTNCHVAHPRAMGMQAPKAQNLAIGVTERSDEAPALTYIAEVVAISPELDLAVIKIVSDMRGRAVEVNLPHVPLGDSDSLDLADNMAIFGYPGIGGDTITFTSGSVAGFTKQTGISSKRAWIKTDATIAGGNSGGTAINHDGELVGIPTQAAAGEGITPVDARPVFDTNRDGRVDRRDTPMAVGGFINGLRPVNLAKPLLKKAGMSVTGPGARATIPMTSAPATTVKRKRRKKSADISDLFFANQVSKSGKPIQPTTVLAPGVTQLNAAFHFENMDSCQKWGQEWTFNGDTIMQHEAAWDKSDEGERVIILSSNTPLQEGEYGLSLTIDDQTTETGKVSIGRRVADTDTELSGTVVDASTGAGIDEALVIALKPGIRTSDFVKMQSPKMAYTSVRTRDGGRFTFPDQLFKGQAYGLVIVARGYQDLAIESALRLDENAPESAELEAIALRPER